ncbi:EAL domain-containing protein [Massilia horti]|uniref:EAL domain-containing protein n=1 Tax=Massilia horti TaxID=2562153 RepID=UPI001E5CBC06|nr:EAL domain-containing protein [Massilia horti]
MLANLAIIAVYVGTVQMSRALDLPPGYASPLFPAAGVGLALAVVAGSAVMPGIALGGLLLYLYMGSLDPSVPRQATLLFSIIAMIGETLQAWLGAALFRRFVRPALDSPRDVGRFLLLAPIICLISAVVAVPPLYWLGMIEPEMRTSTWLSWWAGDTLGVLLAAPLTWIVCAPPRPLWRYRARIVAAPLLLAAAAVVLTYQQAVHWETDQQLGKFRLQAQQAADLMQAEFSEHQRFVDTVARTLGDTGQTLTEQKLQRIASDYIDDRTDIQGIDWAVRVEDDDRAAFEAWARTHVDPGYEIRDVTPDGKIVRAAARARYLPLLYTTSVNNPLLHGLDFYGESGRRNAITKMVRTGRPAATRPLRLVTTGQPGMVLFRGVGPLGELPAGAIIVAIDADHLVRRAAARAGLTEFDYSLDDVTEPARVLPVTSTAWSAEPRGQHDVRLAFADRRYLLRMAPSAAFLANPHGWASWSVLTGGLLLTGLLGALLLLMSGERARIEALVGERTARLRDREARLQAILNNAADAIFTVDATGVVISANAATEALFGYPATHLPGLPFVALVPAPGAEEAPRLLSRLAHAQPEERELKGINARGDVFPLSIAVSRVQLGPEHIFVCILRDLTEQRRSQERIYKLAHHDTLTGLENRFALNERLELQLAHARRTGEPVAVLFIDLDHFKKINDSYGHAAGDRLLVSAAHRMQDLLRDVDTLGRLGGDEFVIVLGGPLTPDSVTAIAVRVVQALTEPYQFDDMTVHSGASVGVALFPADGQDAATLLRHADTAMYSAKREGRGNFQFFSPAMNAATHEHLLLENRMWTALENNGFDLHLQAQVQLATGRVIGAEVLLRWYDEELGSVEPQRFIPVAEESGLILPLGDWVLARTMQLLAEWQDEGLGALRLAVNLSARQFSGGALLGRLDQLLQQHRIDPSRLELEITETAAMRDPESTRLLLRQLRARGFRLAIDDFGTGYSSLAYLKLFAIDRIKIDRGFVKDIETNPNDANIVAATISLAHSLGLAVVAEGVETHAQWGFLREKRGDEAQGFLFARPMPEAQFRDFIRERAQVPGM